MYILIKTTRISSRNNKDQRGYLFRTDEKTVKKSIPRMVWFHASGIVETLNVRWPFITCWSDEGQVDWWSKLKNLSAFKEILKSNLFVGITFKINIIHPGFFDAYNIISNPFIENL